MVKIRLQRVGRKSQPHYRIVAADTRILESFGHYNPRSKFVTVTRERYDWWLAHGAQPTDAAQRICSSE